MASSKKGVILFSFGSLVKTNLLPQQAKLELFKAFTHFPEHTILWKWDNIGKEDAELLAQSPNIHVIEWLPQVDLLNDRRVKVFITHAGLNSYLETTHAGVPIVAIPVLGDQFYNAGCAEKLGIGIHIDKEKITEKAMVDALTAILGTESSSESNYTRRARVLRQMLHKRPEDPKETFIRYLEYAAEFPNLGTGTLQMASVGMPVWKYYCLDIISAVLSALITAMLVLVYVVKLFWGMVLDCRCNKLKKS